MPYIRRVPEDYATIAAAHTAASNGDIIYLNTRETSANATFTKAVHLVGAGGLDASVTETTSFGIDRDSGSGAVACLNYALTSEAAAAVPYLLLENVRIRNQYTNPSAEAIILAGVAPAGGLYLNRCNLEYTANYAAKLITVNGAGWMVIADRCRLSRYSTTALAEYNAALLEGRLYKCLISPALQSNDLAQNWTVKDVVTTATDGYGPTPTDGIVLRLDSLDYEAYRVYGTVTDIPDAITGDQFEIRLYAEKTAQGNDITLLPLQMVPLTLATQHTGFWDGSWEFSYLLPTRRYGVLINPPDGMQGHWLRWYNPATA